MIAGTLHNSKSRYQDPKILFSLFRFEQKAIGFCPVEEHEDLLEVQSPTASLEGLNDVLRPIGNVQLFANLIFILHARWRLKIVCLQTKLASLAIHKKCDF